MPISSRKWMWISLLLTLVLGMSLGILADELLWDRPEDQSQHGRREGGDHLLTKLERELKLTPDQKVRVEKVLAANRQKARDYSKETRKVYAKLRQEFRQEIRAVLSPEQRARFDEMVAEYDARRRRNERRDR